MGGDSDTGGVPDTTGGFQSTPPHGGRLTHFDTGAYDEGFNPRPRMGGDPGLTAELDRVGVSIHAPAWGATITKGDGVKC